VALLPERGDWHGNGRPDPPVEPEDPDPSSPAEGRRVCYDDL